MQAQPDFPAFEAGYRQGEAQVVWTTLVADLETPVSAFLKLAEGRPNAFLLESVEGGAFRGRYSFIGLRPDLVWRCSGNAATIGTAGANGATDFRPCPVGEKEGALASLRHLVARCQVKLPEGLPPMAVCLVGYLGYDMVRLMERLPDANPDILGIPDGVLLRPTIMAVFDSITDKVTVITPVWPDPAVPAADAWSRALERLAGCVAEFDRSLPHRRAPMRERLPLAEPESNITPAAYRAMVERAKEYILAGDIFQVVPSQRFRVPFTLPPFALYRALRRRYRSGRVILLGVRSATRGTILAASLPLIMIDELFNRSHAWSFVDIEMGWVLEDNRAIAAIIERVGGKVDRTFALFEKAL